MISSLPFPFLPLLGFEDGPDNPLTVEKREQAAIIQGGNHLGGSYCMTQKWIHDLDKFASLVQEEQQLVFGRTKGPHRYV